MAATAEMYSWAGESRFNDHDLIDMVKEGAISTGSFSDFLGAIFRTDDAYFTYAGDETQDDRTVSEFGFRVAQERSHYLYGDGMNRLVIGYDGTFLVESKTAELLRLVVRTAPLPAKTEACYASTTLDYARVRLHDRDFLLPSESVLRIFRTDGGESENRITFSNCREFLGESTIRFGVPPALPASSKSASPGFAIPPGLAFRIALTEGIDTHLRGCR